MKKIAILLLISFFVFSCNKENKIIKSPGGLIGPFYAALSGLNLTPYSQDIYDNIFDADRAFDILITHNQGQYVSFLVMGSLNENSSISLNNQLFSPNLDPISYFYAGDGEPYYGTTTNLIYRENSDTLSSLSFYSPEPIVADKISNDGMIERTATSTLTWNDDPNNQAGQVVLVITSYSDEFETSIDEQILVIDDIGYYDVSDSYQNTNVKAIKMILIRGNGQNVTMSDGGEIFMNVRSQDHHFYMIVD